MNFSKKNHLFKIKNLRAMSKSIKTIFGIVVFGIMLTTVSCKDAKKDDATTTTEHSEMMGKEHTSAYVCPMHCKGSGSDKEGSCPACGMDYVKNKDFEKGDENHDDHTD